MSWFGFGGSKDEPPAPQPMKIDDFSSGSHFDNSADFAAPRAASSGSIGGGSSFEHEIQMEQQKALVQAILIKLTDAAFDSCITKPSSSMSSSENSCVQSVVGKYLATTELIVQRMNGPQH